MNKKFIGLFIIFFVAILAMGSVGAAKLENHNFDDNFWMKVPKDTTFQKQNDSINENGLNQISLSYINNDLLVLYMDSMGVSENSSKWFYQTMFESINMDLNECYETQEGDLIILEPKKIDEMHFPVVGVSSGNKNVMLMGNDVDLLKDMAHTIEFK